MITSKQNSEHRALTYFLIEEGQPILRVQKYFSKYDKALRESRGLNCIVTNASWLRRRGVDLEIQTKTKPKGAEIVAGVTINGILLEAC